MTATSTVLLDHAADPHFEPHDHPDVLTPEDEAAGLAAWQAVDDLDDDDNGIASLDLRTAAPTGYVTARKRARIVKRCLLAAGVPEVSIELVSGRPGTGDDWNLLDPVAVLSHHIASRPTVANPTPGLSLVKTGRSDLEGPLCNGTAGVDLVYRIVTLGMANHPGVGGPLTVKGPMGRYTIPRDTGRVYLWGTEYEGGYDDEVWNRRYTNKRTGKTMTFREFMGRANAGLVRAIWLINSHDAADLPEHGKWLAGYHGEHKTWAPDRKVDRRGYTTRTGRDEVRKFGKAPS